MIVDGRAIAAEILAETKRQVEALGRPLVVRAIAARPSAATESYLRIKGARAEDAGMRLEVVQVPDDSSTETVIAEILKPGADAIIVQLPLPDDFDQDTILAAIPVSGDADVLSPATYAHFLKGEGDALIPPVAGAVAEILQGSGVIVRGKRALVIGNGRLVGQPVFEWLHREGAEVTVVTHHSQEALPMLLPHMDIVVSGAGSPNLIRPEFLKDGVVLIDAGTSESNGQLAGDADPACAEVASVFTPVPGGVGPIAVACLFRNAAKLAQNLALTNPVA